ncbi:MAG TPA: polyprenyl synthetase family protein [Bacteroidia bacterium]|nr:polyprenyl synthetase family protein [Bacteroidia bacterium]
MDFELEEFNKSLLNKKPASLYDPIKYTLDLGGKRMRPLLTLIACDLFDGNVSDAVKPALGIEIFHNFTLLHDDIMDKAPLRRNQPTVHKKWNADIAILSGDTMFVQSFQYVMQAPNSCLKEVMEVFTKTAIEVCEGQQMDMDFESQINVSIPQYIKMIGLKTSVLLAGSMKIGAIIGEARQEDANHLYEFGKNLGIAFQLQDDILDVFGNSDKVGKQSGGDIVSNKKTFLLLKALDMADRYKKEELQLWMHTTNVNPTEKIEAVKSIYEYLGVKSLAEAEMHKFYTKSLLHLNEIPCNETKKEQLKSFAQNLMQRES